MPQSKTPNPEEQALAPERHPFDPFIPAGARLLMLGSFPPPANRWSIPFYYPNWINDMWRIMGRLYYGDDNHFCLVAEKRFDQPLIVDFLTRTGIALFDTATVVRRLRGNASDRFLEVVQPTDVPALLSHMPQCTAVAATGEKAAQTVAAQMGIEAPAKVGQSVPFALGKRTLNLYRMPSTSRAYPAGIAKKSYFYSQMLKREGLLST